MNFKNPEVFKEIIKWSIFMMLSIIVVNTTALSQDTTSEKPEIKPVRNMFESIWLIDNQTVVVPIPGTFEWDIQHRFGVLKNGYDDFFGLFAPSNFRLGFNYVPIENLMIGFGFTKERLIWDFTGKYAIIQQSRGGEIPVSISYLVNAGWDTRKKENFVNSSDRLSYFHQLMVARKITDGFSLQGSLSLSHFNAVEGILNDNQEEVALMKNDHLAFALLTRIKISAGTSIIANYDQPLTNHLENKPKSNISIGIEFTSSSHAFQIFLANYRALVPQYNNVFNQNEFGDGGLLLGFNITRLWNF